MRAKRVDHGLTWASATKKRTNGGRLPLAPGRPRGGVSPPRVQSKDEARPQASPPRVQSKHPARPQASPPRVQSKATPGQRPGTRSKSDPRTVTTDRV
jgi:hypothetical protein